ncbi:MAG: isochorismate synthase [Actinobacteria bacterium]|nr:isochorismate synthase [Actinomycetota bacterium]
MRSGRSGAGRRAATEQGFGPAAYERLARRVDAALLKARSRGRTVVAGVTVPVPAGLDPLAHVAAAREPGEAWTCFEQPARNGHSIATLGIAVEVSAEGAGRFADVARDCATTLDAAEIDDLADDPDAPAGAGPAWVGGFGFFADGPYGDAWHGMPPARFTLPAAALVRGLDQARLTLNVAVAPDDDAAALIEGVERLVERLALDDVFDERPPAAPIAAGWVDQSASVSSVASPSHYEQAVARGTELIAAGELEKLVLAREVVLRRGHPIDCVAVLQALRERFPECTLFALARGDTVFLGATPELLIRREGRRASTLALAGSIRRGADEQTDRHLGEQLLASDKDNREHAFVVRQIERTLGRLSAWTAVGERPELVKVKNIQHLATPIRAQLTEPRPVIELAGLLHPTPAVGGEPWPKAGDAIRSLEGFDRGWYTGGVGWMDQLEDGEFHVALRSALVQGDHARLFAGAGIVGDSDPASELAETETKLEALLPVLSRC